MPKTRGFTLIELMVTVSIIAILAAIAIPQYQQYVSRARWADNISGLSGVKMAISECLQVEANVPAACDTVAELNAGGYSDIAALPALQYGSVTLTTNTAALVITGSSQANGCIVTLTPTITTASVSWVPALTPAANCTKATTGF